jgi:metacaspase-1
VTTDESISLEELMRRLGDTNIDENELRPYFQVDPERSGPFAPALEIDPTAVDLPSDPAEAAARSALALNAANWWARMRRRAAFDRRIADGYTGPVIVSEGDSWFQYPILLDDIIDHLSRKFAILSLDAAGDTLGAILAKAEYRSALRETGAAILLFSAGGNDLLGGGNLAGHLRQYDPAIPQRPAADYLLPSFDAVLAGAVSGYDRLLHDIERNFPQVAVVCHGYDRPLPSNERWLGKPMASRGITDPALQEAIVAVMIDRFNAALARLTRLRRAEFIDLRDIVGRERWHDELHPTDDGFGTLAARFEDAIDRLAALTAPARAVGVEPRARAEETIAGETPAPPAQAEAPLGPRKGISLHIGLNALDPAHYAGWDGRLAACEFDAEDMQRIAATLGYATTTLLTAAATREAVMTQIREAADQLVAGDVYLVTYSGHGGQVPDFNSDEIDGIDETWCLFDAQLVDDEIYHLWSGFAEGVRVLVISDSCHSGTVIKAAITDHTFTLDESGPRLFARRAMPKEIAARVFRQNRDFYTALGRSFPWGDESLLSKELTHPVRCTVRLLSGCQDNQYSYDGLANGQFTAALLDVWSDGRFSGDYHAFHAEILKRMPPHQSPNHWVVGQHDPIYDRQRPFEI